MECLTRLKTNYLGIFLTSIIPINLNCIINRIEAIITLSEVLFWSVLLSTCFIKILCIIPAYRKEILDCNNV